MTEDTIMVRVDNKLLEKARNKYPGTKGLTATGLVDFLVRKALEV